MANGTTSSNLIRFTGVRRRLDNFIYLRRLSLDKELGRHVDSKTAALEEGERIWLAVREGKAAASAPVTLAQLGAIYFEKYVSPKTGAPLGKNERYKLDLMMRTDIRRSHGVNIGLGALNVADVTRHDIQAFIDVQRQPKVVEVGFNKSGRRGGVQRRGGVVSTNRCLGRLRAFYNWAVVSGYVETTPFKKGGVNVIRLFKELERERRLEPQEEDLLLAEANPKLRALIIAALETGCRIGELVALRWRQVRWDLNEIHLSNRTTKGQRTRCLPMSQRVRAVLEMRQHDPAGNVLPGDTYVFGDEVGGQVKSVKTAWENLRLRIYGHPVTRLANGKLAPCCRAKLAAINLHLHDLRRESGSRMLEGGMPLNIVQAFLDHANISTSSRYLKVTRVGMHAAMKRYEDARGGTNRAQTGRGDVESVVHSAVEEAPKPLGYQQLRSTTGA
jgi:integrase